MLSLISAQRGKVKNRSVRAALLLLASIATSGCSTLGLSPDANSGIAQGPHRPIGKGEAWTWVKTNDDGHVAAVGVSFDEAALNGLPNTGPMACCGGPEYSLPMPTDISSGGYTHVVINWNPKGHPPIGIYDKPHFDFHFYTLAEPARRSISAKGSDEAICLKPVSPKAVPLGFVEFPQAIPQMGVHWGNPGASEFHGTPFTATFIYGSYNGKISFTEPMITLAYLQSHPDVTIPIAVPEERTEGLLLPAAYTVKFDTDARIYSVALQDQIK